jgi:GTP-binding protein Era
MSDQATDSSAPQSAPQSNPNFRAGFVALIGQPNAGKSTLMNKILGEKASIVSDKPQTTRGRVQGILTLPDAQVIFVDSPGVLKSTTGINKFLQAEAMDAMEQSDVILLLLAADSSEDHAKSLVEMARKAKKPWFAIITKNDMIGGTRVPKFFNYFMEEKVEFVSISSMRRPDEARAEVLAKVLPHLPKAKAHLFEPDMYTTQTMRQIAAEFIREACFENLHQEIPYGLAVRIIQFSEEEAIPIIRAELVIEKENHKAIVIGAKGATIKKIGMESRKAIEKVMDQQIFLELHVQVKENWSQNPRMMKELGYVLPQDRR